MYALLRACVIWLITIAATGCQSSSQVSVSHTQVGIATPVNGKTPKGLQWSARTSAEQQAQWVANGIRSKEGTRTGK
jgi:hypothetical protein